MEEHINSSQVPLQDLRAILIFGPTAVGKTRCLEHYLQCRSLNPMLPEIEVISADSRQVYSQIKIATAYPNDSLCSQVPHHLIGIKDPHQNYNVYEFVTTAYSCIDDIITRSKFPLVIGGTAFYLYNLWKGLPQTPKSDKEVRNSLREDAVRLGQKGMYEKLLRVDPVYAKNISSQDSYRTLRALEVFTQTGIPLSQFAEHEMSSHTRKFKVCGFIRPREHLYQRINTRVDRMVEVGLLQEAHRLWKMNLSKETNAYRTIGVQEFLDNEEVCSSWAKGIQPKESLINTVVEQIKLRSRRYAKRQITFFKRFSSVEWIDLEKYESCDSSINADLHTWNKVFSP